MATLIGPEQKDPLVPPDLPDPASPDPLAQQDRLAQWVTQDQLDRQAQQARPELLAPLGTLVLRVPPVPLEPLDPWDQQERLGRQVQRALLERLDQRVQAVLPAQPGPVSLPPS